MCRPNNRALALAHAHAHKEVDFCENILFNWRQSVMYVQSEVGVHRLHRIGYEFWPSNTV